MAFLGLPNKSHDLKHGPHLILSEIKLQLDKINIQNFFSDFPSDLVIFRGESSDKHIDASDNTVLPRVFNFSGKNFANSNLKYIAQTICCKDVRLFKSH